MATLSRSSIYIGPGIEASYDTTLESIDFRFSEGGNLPEIPYDITVTRPFTLMANLTGEVTEYDSDGEEWAPDAYYSIWVGDDHPLPTIGGAGDTVEEAAYWYVYNLMYDYAVLCSTRNLPEYDIETRDYLGRFLRLEGERGEAF